MQHIQKVYRSGALRRSCLMLCTGNSRASAPQNLLSNRSKSQGGESCRLGEVGSSGLGAGHQVCWKAVYKSGAGSCKEPRAPRASQQGRVRHAGCNLQSQEMTPATNKSWFGTRAVEQTPFQGSAVLQYYNLFATYNYNLQLERKVTSYQLPDVAVHPFLL